MHAATNIAVVGLLVFLAHLFAGIFSRTRIPDVLMLIGIGLLLGPVFGMVGPQQFGSVGPFFTTVTLVIILFEAGLNLDLDVLTAAFRGPVLLTLVSFFVVMCSVGAASLFLLHLDSKIAFMLGAIVASTSPAVIVPLSRKLHLQEHTRGVLLLESAVSDVLSIVVSLALLAAYQFGKLRVGAMIGEIISTLFVAAVAGIVAAFIWSALLNRVRSLENSMLITPAFVFVLFGAVELLHFSGFIAALAFGATLGNIESFHSLPWLKQYLPTIPISLNETERIFLAEVVFLLATFFFIYIGISVRLTNRSLVLTGLALAAVIMVLRVPTVWFTLNRSTPVRDASLVAVMGAKGLAAAVLGSIPFQQHLPGGEIIQDVTYSIILFSIVMTALMTFLIDRTWMGGLYRFIFSSFGQARPMKAIAMAEGASGFRVRD